MADWRYFAPSFWTDSYILKLDKLETFVYIYLFTNQHCNQAGIYEIPIEVMEFELKMTKEEIEPILEKFQKEGKIEYVDNVMWVKNFLKHQPNKSLSVWKRIKKDIEKVQNHSDKLLKRYFEHLDTLSIPYPEGVNTLSTPPHPLIDDTIRIGKGKGKEQEKEKEETSCPKNYRFSDEQMEMVEKFIGLIKRNKPNYRFSGGNFKERWANEVRLMVEIDKRPLKRVGEVMEFALSHPFWKKNILSVEKLRKQFDRLELEMDDEKREDDDDLPILRGE